MGMSIKEEAQEAKYISASGASACAKISSHQGQNHDLRGRITTPLGTFVTGTLIFFPMVLGPAGFLIG